MPPFFGHVHDNDVQNNPTTLASVYIKKFHKKEEAKKAGFTGEQIKFFIKYKII